MLTRFWWKLHLLVTVSWHKLSCLPQTNGRTLSTTKSKFLILSDMTNQFLQLIISLSLASSHPKTIFSTLLSYPLFYSQPPASKNASCSTHLPLGRYSPYSAQSPLSLSAQVSKKENFCTFNYHLKESHTSTWNGCSCPPRLQAVRHKEQQWHHLLECTRRELPPLVPLPTFLRVYSIFGTL